MDRVGSHKEGAPHLRHNANTAEALRDVAQLPDRRYVAAAGVAAAIAPAIPSATSAGFMSYASIP
jgi:hypothetical protein